MATTLRSSSTPWLCDRGTGTHLYKALTLVPVPLVSYRSGAAAPLGVVAAILHLVVRNLDASLAPTKRTAASLPKSSRRMASARIKRRSRSRVGDARGAGRQCVSADDSDVEPLRGQR
jgi:hypothetical protein